MNLNKWGPIILDDGKLKAKTYAIAEILKKSKDDSLIDLGLHSGQTGVCVFLFYYSVFSKNYEYSEKAFDIIDSIITKHNTTNSTFTFCSGLSGIVWALNHLSSNNFIKTEQEIIVDEVKKYLHNSMIYALRRGNWDFLHGGLGVCLFFLSDPSNEEYRRYVSQFIDELDMIAIRFNNGSIAWTSKLDYEKGTMGYNLGLAHGLASIIAFLSKTYKYGINSEKSFHLLSKAIEYILNNTLDDNKYYSYFPIWVCEGEQSLPSRMAWCYGDLGIANSLWMAAQALNDPTLEYKSIQVLLHSTKRRKTADTSITDAGICHGAIGVAHLYNRMYHRTGIEEFKESASYWYQTGLNIGQFSDGLAGYKSRHVNEWVQSKGMLEGISGIGLGLISAMSKIEPKWDECLLIS